MNSVNSIVAPNSIFRRFPIFAALPSSIVNSVFNKFSSAIMALFLLACMFTVVLAAPAWADQCSAPTLGPGAGSVDNDTAGVCSVIITVATVDGNGTATSFSVTSTGQPAYDGTEDILVGVQNNSSGTLIALPLTSTDPIFGFDGDGPCAFNGSDCFVVEGTGYEGPHNSFIVTNANTGTVNFGTGVQVGGSTWFALEGTPQSLQLASITQTLHPGMQTIYQFPGFNDPYKITPSSTSAGGEILTITTVPVLKTNFIPPANFPNESCVPFADYSTGGQDTCVEYQADCTGSDCNTLLYQLMVSYDLPADLPAIGGPDMLVVHGSGCPTAPGALAQSVFTDYSVSRIDPTTTSKGGGTGSCFIVTYTPGAPLITNGTTSRFTGFGSPVINDQLNLVKSGSTRPLNFTWLDNQGNPVTNLNWCANMTGVGCTAPWVNLSYFSISCSGSNGNGTNDATDISAPGNSGLQNLGGGNYQMNWQTKGLTKGTCATVQVTFDNGVTLIPAIGFQFN